MPVRFLHPRFWPTWLGLGVVLALGCLPRRVRHGLARLLAPLLGWRGGRSGRIVDINLQLCFAGLSLTERRRLRRAYERMLVMSILDTRFCWFASAERLRQQVRVEGLERLQQLAAEGRPVILTVCHSLALEVVASRLALDLPMVGYAEAMRNALADHLINRARQRWGGVLLRRGDSLRRVVRALRDGGMLYYFVDEDHGRQNSLFARFFGHPKAVVNSLPRLCQLSGAVVVSCHGYYDWQSACYRVEFGAVQSQVAEQTPEQAVAQLAQECEEKIRRVPDQYLWKLKLLHTQPEGVSPYASP